MTQDIYDDKIRFSFEDKGHKYTVSHKVDEVWGTPVPVTGVTTVCSVISKDALVQWSANEASAYFVNNLKTLDDLALIASEAKNAHRKKADLGKAHGSVGHALVEKLLKGQPIDKILSDEARSVQTAFLKWQEDFKPEVLQNEYPFYSLTSNYAGTCDLIANINDKLTLVDFKTTNRSRYNPDGIYAENFCQLGGYLIGLEEMLGLEFEEAMIVNLPKDGTEYAVRSLSDIGLTMTDAKLYFRNALGLYELNKTFNWKVK